MDGLVGVDKWGDEDPERVVEERCHSRNHQQRSNLAIRSLFQRQKPITRANGSESFVTSHTASRRNCTNHFGPKFDRCGNKLPVHPSDYGPNTENNCRKGHVRPGKDGTEKKKSGAIKIFDVRLPFGLPPAIARPDSVTPRDSYVVNTFVLVV